MLATGALSTEEMLSVFSNSAPVTIAGALVSVNANLMAAIVLFQLARPGTRIFLNNFTFPQNMRTGSPAFGDVGIPVGVPVAEVGAV